MSFSSVVNLVREALEEASIALGTAGQEELRWITECGEHYATTLSGGGVNAHLVMGWARRVTKCRELVSRRGQGYEVDWALLSAQDTLIMCAMAMGYDTPARDAFLGDMVGGLDDSVSESFWKEVERIHEFLSPGYTSVAEECIQNALANARAHNKALKAKGVSNASTE